MTDDLEYAAEESMLESRLWLDNLLLTWSSGSEPEAPDYTTMDGATLLKELGDDAAKWAAAFRQSAQKLGYADMDEQWLAGWFASAIEHATTVRLNTKGATRSRQ
jgi:hypothetical protein